VASEFLRHSEIELTAIDGYDGDDTPHGFLKVRTDKKIERIFGDALSALASVPDNSYHVAFALDIIEHLSKEDGYRLIYELNRVSSHGFGLSCPAGFAFQPPSKSNPLQAHISAWEPKEFRRMGFTSIKAYHGLAATTLPYAKKRYPLSPLTAPFYLLDVAVGKLFPNMSALFWAFRWGKLPSLEEDDDISQIDRYF
jgi:hypothetical protein